MKKANVIFILILLIMEGYGRNNRSGDTGDIIVQVDVETSYPKKELILQDFMDVEYIALESSDEFVCEGNILDMSKKIILVRNNFQDGTIYVFDRNDKGIRKINRYRNGNEEYTIILGVVLDEENDEIFVNDVFTSKIMVYNLYGNFKRSIRCNEGFRSDNIYNFDKENLICEVGGGSETLNKSTFIILSKQDGSIVNKIEIPYKQKKSTKINEEGGLFIIYPYGRTLPLHDSWILSEASADTVFRFLPDYSMIPFIIRTPSIQSMSPEVFFFPKVLTDRYYFMEKVKKENTFLKTDLMYDRQEKSIYEYVLYNNDYSNKERVNIGMWRNNKDEIGYYQKIEAYKLVEAYKKNKLKGKLKDVAAKLDKDSNAVIMLVKNKKSIDTIGCTSL